MIWQMRELTSIVLQKFRMSGRDLLAQILEPVILLVVVASVLGMTVGVQWVTIKFLSAASFPNMLLGTWEQPHARGASDCECPESVRDILANFDGRITFDKEHVTVGDRQYGVERYVFPDGHHRGGRAVVLLEGGEGLVFSRQYGKLRWINGDLSIAMDPVSGPSFWGRGW